MRVTRVARVLSAMAVAGLGLVAATGASASTTNSGTSVIYNSVVASPIPGNLPSLGAEAYAFNELGNEVTFAAGTNRHLSNVVVEMSSWACQSGAWYSADCVSAPGATFDEPVTLNIYDAVAGSPTPGSLITSVTQTFAMPYRPSTSAQCTGGRWWDSSLKQCFNGYGFNITFNMAGAVVPDTIVYGISYNTSHFGPAPYGEATSCYTTSEGCGYDLLNVALSQDPTNVTVGTDANPGTLWQSSIYGGQYCDAGAAGTGFFRIDSPTTSCWGVNAPDSAPYYVPAVQFKAGAVGHH
jgi:hypothetical protein